MNAISAQQALDEYDQAAKKISKTLARRMGGALDCNARSQDDYLQDLRLGAIEIAARFQESHGFCLPAERRYVRKSLWNLSRDWLRAHNRADKHLVPGEAPEKGYVIDGQLDAIHCLKTLEVKLPATQWHLLCRVAEAGGSVCASFDPEMDSCLTTHKNRVKQAREAAQKILRE